MLLLLASTTNGYDDWSSHTVPDTLNYGGSRSHPRGGGSRTPPANLPRSLLVLQEVKYLPRSKPTCVINQFNIFLEPQRPGMLRVYGPRWSHLQWKAGLCQQQLDTGHRRSSPGSSSAAVLGKDLSVQAFLLCCENPGGPGTRSHLPLSRARDPKIGDLIWKAALLRRACRRYGLP